MIFSYVSKDLIRNPRRTLSTMIGVFLGIALTCAILFFVDGLSASMTQRAIAPLPVDMQRVVTTISTPAELTLSYSQESTAVGDIVNVQLIFKNVGFTPANEVIIRSVISDKLKYLAGSARIDNEIIDMGEENPFAHGLAKEGLNIGTVEPGKTVELKYQVEAINGKPLTDQDFRATFSTREVLTPVKANIGRPISLSEMIEEIKTLPGVAFAEELYIADFPTGSVASEQPIVGPVRVFGFDTAYLEEDETIQIIEGTQESGAVLVSFETAEKLGVGVGDMITLTLPDNTDISKRVSGITDLTRARSIFSSRHGANLEVFLYVQNSIVLDTASFKTEVLPTYERAVTTRGERIKSLPIQEIDIKVKRELLNAEPSAALFETALIAESINEVAKGQGFVIDHVSNTLEVASGDASVAKQMFIFLGLPGVLLAAFLAAYSGIVLSNAARREQATLRVRGASRKHLLAMLSVRVSFIALGGAIGGVVLGFLTTISIIGLSTLLRATGASLFLSALIGMGSGLVATGTALYLAGRRSIDEEINSDRAKLENRKPRWRRYWFDVIGLTVVSSATTVVIILDGFAGTPGSVYVGQSVTVNLWLLFLPITLWIGGSLLGGRLLALLLSKKRLLSAENLRQPFHILYGLSIKRRAWSLAEAAIIISLIIAFGTSLAVFTDSYSGAKAADARYVLGADIKISATAASTKEYHSSDAEIFMANDIEAITPVIYSIHNVILRSDRTSDVANLAAIDPLSYQAVAPVKDEHFLDGSAENALLLLQDKPQAVLLSFDMAQFLQLRVGDIMHILLGRAKEEQTEIAVEVVGFYEKLPGFPDGADALMNITLHEEAITSIPVSFFLVKTKAITDLSLEDATHMLQSGTEAENALMIENRLTAFDKDQSSLAALNIDGLLKIDSIYSLAMGMVVIAIFVFGLLLSRRREYVTLKAQGMSSGAIRTLIGAEALTATIGGVLIGIPIGLTMAYYFINVLRPLFVLNPPYILPLTTLFTIVGSVIITAFLTSIIASIAVNRLSATELLRDE